MRIISKLVFSKIFYISCHIKVKYKIPHKLMIFYKYFLSNIFMQIMIREITLRKKNMILLKKIELS